MRLPVVLMILELGFICAGMAASNDTASSHPLLLVANQRDHSVSILDPESGQQISTIPEGGVTGHELAASPDGRLAFVPIYGNSGVGRPGTDGRNMVVIDIASRRVVGNVDFGHGVRPHAAVFGPKDGLLYITTELDNSVTIVDPHTLKIIGSIPTRQRESHMLAISHDGRRGYTANVGSGTVSVLDMEARKTLAVIPISAVTQRISISADDRLVFTPDQTKAQIAVIDTATNKVKTWIPLPATAFGTTAAPDGHWLLAAMPESGKVAVIDLTTFKLARTVDVPGAPQEILMRPDGAVAYVSCDWSRKVAAIRTSDWTVEKTLDAGNAADGLAWAVQ